MIPTHEKKGGKAETYSDSNQPCRSYTRAVQVHCLQSCFARLNVTNLNVSQGCWANVLVARGRLQCNKIDGFYMFTLVGWSFVNDKIKRTR